MPRCAARHVKLVAEAEQLVLPFLAPRVFQPWSNSLPQSSSTSHSHNKSFSTTSHSHNKSFSTTSHSHKKSFSTTSCEHARQSGAARPKHESARSLLVQQWYESAIAPLQEDANHDHQDHVKNSDKDEQPAPSLVRGKRRLSRAHVQKAFFQRWSTSQALVKSRWTATKRPSTLRLKYVPLGRPVRRKPRDKPADDKTEELVFSADGHSLYWSHHFAKLNARHDTRLKHNFTPRTTPNLNFRSQKWAAQILDVKKLKDQEELARLLGEQWRRKWMHALLWTLANSVDDALRLLEITHISPYMPAAYVADALSFIVGHYHKKSLSDDTRNHLLQVACTIMERPGTSPLQIGGHTFHKFLQFCSQDQVLNLFEHISISGTLLHWNTRLHFTSYLAHHGRFDQALDTLLDAVSDGADVSSNQFESCCATILRKAADQPDGLRVSLRLVQNLSDIGVKLNVQLCNIVMLNAVEAGDLKTAFSIYHSLVDNDLKADEYTHAILLKGCKTAIEDSETLNTTIRQAIADVEVRNLYVVATEIIHCLYLHHFQIDPENAFSIVSEAYSQLFDTSDLINLAILPQKYANKSSNRKKPTLPAMGIMIGAYLRHTVQSQSRNMGHIHDLYRRWRKLAEHNVSPHVFLAQKDYVSNAFLLAFAQDPSGLAHAAEVIRDMQTPFSHARSQSKPTVRSWSIFLHAFAKHGKMELAEQVLTYMRERKQTPNEVTWNSLLGGYAKLGKANEAVETFVRMRDEKFEADEVTKRHLGKVNLGAVDRSIWESASMNTPEVRVDELQQQKAPQTQEAATTPQKENDKAGSDSTDGLAKGVQAMSV